MITNPYAPPPPGSDDPHMGVDFSDMMPDTQIAVAGRTVLASLSGRVAGVSDDRFPYGNSVIIETPLADFPPEWVNSLETLAASAQPVTPVALWCPEGIPWVEESGSVSLYILYAHLEQPTGLVMGRQVTVGQVLGTVGMSGNALNPHLHLETRVGPSGVDFASMAHYDTGASYEEMTTYCTWRVGGQFVLLDPMKLFEIVTLEG